MTIAASSLTRMEKNSVEPKTKIFHDLKSYFNSKFKEVQKETKRLAKRINTETHQLKYRRNQLQLGFNNSVTAHLDSITNPIKNSSTEKLLEGVKRVICDFQIQKELTNIAHKLYDWS